MVLVYIRQVTMTRQDRNTQHKHTTNTDTMVIEHRQPIQHMQGALLWLPSSTASNMLPVLVRILVRLIVGFVFV